MKICVLSTSYPRSKDDYWVPFVHSWCREIAKTEDVIVVTSGGPGAKSHEIIDNVKIHRFNYFWPKSLQRLTYRGGMKESFKKELLPKLQAPFFMLAFLAKSLKMARKCDVIHAHWVPAGFAAVLAKALFKKPVVLTEHGGSMRGLPKFFNRFVLKRVDVVTSAHDDVLQFAKQMGAKNAVKIRNFLDEDKFLKNYDANAAKKELGIKNERVATFIGRFEDLKDPLAFVNAMPLVIGKMKNVKFVMVGDGHLKEDLEKQVKNLGIEKHVIMPGPVRDVGRFLAFSDVFVACSATENCFSTTILEAMLSRVPCVITKAGMTEKFFTHKKYAYLVEKKSPESLACGITALLKDAKLRKKLSENGLEFLDRYEFRNKAIINKIMEVFRKTLS